MRRLAIACRLPAVAALLVYASTAEACSDCYHWTQAGSLNEMLFQMKALAALIAAGVGASALRWALRRDGG